MMKNVTIYGSGMSGLIAAINLAKAGHDVIVHEKEKTYGGNPLYNPSIHMTPILPGRVSEYIGIDITPAFHPLLDFPMYFHETKIQFPIHATYVVERGPRPQSLDTLLYGHACEAGVKFVFNSPLRKQDIAHLQPGTIIACGLTKDVYDMLGVPCRMVYGWQSSGAIGFDQRTWCWWDECITDYGYLSTANGLYYNLLFSEGRHVSREALARYEDFMWRNEGVEHDNWDYMSIVIPMGNLDNPQLVRNGLIMCGTMSGFMDPFVFFGINGAIVSGKIAAMAVDDMRAAHQEFHRFSKYFKRVYLFKNKFWSPYVRPRVGMLEKVIKTVGPQRMDAFLDTWLHAGSHKPLLGIPGFSHIGTCY